ncbi:CHAD domain-containing protein [Streptomyces sp. CA-111067]|uniref:CHAD domain-containing protein n=1 Tax=Streptomyces sp. CA-111067 TaxID=3240046 RepID=UPI003D98D424
MLTRYLRERATDFLRGLALRGENEAEADALLRGSARRIGGALHTFAPLTDPAWAEPLRAELGWLASTLSREAQYTGRLARLQEALRRLSVLADPVVDPEALAAEAVLSGAGRGPVRMPANASPAEQEAPVSRGAGLPVSAPAGQEAPAGRGARLPVNAPADQDAPTGRGALRLPAASAADPGGGSRMGLRRPAATGGPLALGAARAAALLERQLTLARTRAHSAALQAVGSSRFHALADSVAVLASDVPLSPVASGPAASVLPPLAAQAHQRLAEAAGALPLHRAAHPYNADAVQAALGAELTADLQDAPWHQVRILLRLSRYATEVCRPRAAAPEPEAAGEAGDPESRRLAEAAGLLGRHREAAESAAAVAAAARTPRIAPATAYALGVLHADQRHEVEAARFAFSRLWQRTATVPGARHE